MWSRRRVLQVGIAASLGSALPEAIAQVVGANQEKSKQERGLTIYSNMDAAQWQLIITAFQSKYPWIKVQTQSFGASEAILRYEAERASGSSAADMIVTGSVPDWIRFADKGLGLDYASAEAASLPEWSKLANGVYTFSVDPMGIAYSKLTLSDSQRPSSLAELSEAIAKNPALYGRKGLAYSVTSAFGGAINWAYVRDQKDVAWQRLKAIGPSLVLGDSSGTMIEKLARGESNFAVFVSGPSFQSAIERGMGKIIEFKPLKDGTPFFLRGMAIPSTTQSPESAKLLLDFILSAAGQVAISKAGFVPYRSGLPADQLKFGSFESISKEIGAANVILINLDRNMAGNLDSFVKEWQGAVKK